MKAGLVSTSLSELSLVEITDSPLRHPPYNQPHRPIQVAERDRAGWEPPLEESATFGQVILHQTKALPPTPWLHGGINE
jgi:hypothetical protein